MPPQMPADNNDQLRTLLREELEPLMEEIRNVQEQLDRVVHDIEDLQSEMRDVPNDLDRIESDVDDIARG